jgi:putative ABC transport system substrate-binding protein
MRRRDFIAGIAGSAAAWPLAARAQPAAGTLRVGTVSFSPRSAPIWVAFEQRLAELGYQGGSRNFAFEFIQISSYEGYESGFRELVARKVDIIFHGAAEVGLRWALKVTTLPIVLVTTDYDPLAHGYVTSLARPSGRITGVFPQQIELAKKRLQIFKEALPDLQTATMFWDVSSEDQWKAMSAGAGEFGLRLVGVELRGEQSFDYEAALMQAPPDHRGALIVPTSPAFYRDLKPLAELALRHRIPSIFGFREWIVAGGLLSYGSNLPAMFRRAADYVGRIAKGAKPADLPIEQPTKFELILNLRTARAIGITVSPQTLVRADEVIE